MPDILKLILYLLVFIAILYGAYYFSKAVASYSNGFSKSKYMETVDKLTIARDKSIAIVRIGKKNILLGISGDGLKLIQELEEEDLISAKHTGETPRYNPSAAGDDLIVRYIKKCAAKILSFVRKHLKTNTEIQGFTFRELLSKRISSKESAELPKENTDEI